MDVNNDAIINVPIKSLRKFENYPFLIHEDESMAELVKSIKENGVLTPLNVLPTDDGKFEIISGHRRKRACELAGITELPVIVKHLSRDDAIIQMVDSNIQREKLLPSELAKAYSMRYEAIKRKRGRPTIDDSSDKEKGKARKIIADKFSVSDTTVDRYRKMNSLIPEIMDLVDKNKLGLSSAYELAFLSPDEQKTVLTSIETEGAPSRSQALRLKKLSKEGNFNDDTAFTIMQEQKKPESFNVIIPYEKISKYFSKNCSPAEIAERLLALCERIYQQKQNNKQHSNER